MTVIDGFELPRDSSNAYGKPIWFDKVQTEYRACREGVSVIDMSTFTKFELQVLNTIMKKHNGKVFFSLKIKKL